MLSVQAALFQPLPAPRSHLHRHHPGNRPRLSSYRISERISLLVSLHRHHPENHLRRLRYHHLRNPHHLNHHSALQHPKVYLKRPSYSPILFVLCLLRIISLTKYSSPNTHHCSALLHSDLIIPSHSHAQNTHSNIINVFGCNVNT